MRDFSTQITSAAFTLKGRVLVEASAGSGKTYNIQNAYLRLVISMGLPVRHILVVTFTEAATRELRERLRAILTKCRDRLEGILSDQDEDCARIDRMLELPLSQNAARDRTDLQVERARRALMDFDGAAICTIHGFCKRILDRYAFECGHDPEARLSEACRPAVETVCRDWWRAATYRNANFAATLPFQDINRLQQLVTEIIANPDARPQPPPAEPGPADLSSLHAALRALLAHPRPASKRALNAKAHGVCDTATALLQRTKAPLDLPLTSVLLRELIKQLAGAKWPDYMQQAASTVSSAAKLIQKSIHAMMLHHGCLLAARAQDFMRDHGILTYDRMLLHVRDVLDHPTAGPRLLQVLRKEFHAALIDEFQDTDGIQYDIFHKLFDTPETPLIFVGDPKQAIYGFRGGDIFTYHTAVRDIPPARIYTLQANYRAESALVAAINEFFLDAPGRPTFHDPRITYNTPLTPADISPDRRLLIDGQRDRQPLRIWEYQAPGSRIPARDSSTTRHIYRHVAGETIRLLTEPRLWRGERRLRPNDIAILVLDRLEAEAMQAALNNAGVQAVRQASGNVFDSEEAAGLILVIQAILNPGRDKAVRSALCAGILPCSTKEVRRFNSPAADAAPPATPDQPPATLTQWTEIFLEAAAVWRRHTFLEAFQQLMDRLDLRAHLLRQPDGERRLTNLLQLADLAHQAERGEMLAPTALLRWLATQTDPEQREDRDEFKIRLTSDEEAVRIMTIFKSKGLEFPVVFLPTLWRRGAYTRSNRNLLLRHHDLSDGKMILNADPDNATGKRLAENEALEENIRLAYVGLTRAINRTYLCIINQEGHNPPTALNLLTAGWRARCPSDQSGHIRYEPPPENVPERPPSPAAAAQTLTTAGIPQVDKTRGYTSYSSLTRQTEAPEPRDIDAADLRPEPDSATDAILAIPGGARTGECWHHIFETMDFQAAPEALHILVNQGLQRYGLCQGDRPEETLQRAAVQRMVSNVLEFPLPAAPGPFRLREISASARRHELHFQFSLKQAGRRITLSDLGHILSKYWHTPARDEAYLQMLRTVPQPLPHGVMTGIIDLVCEHQGCMHIIDWKSNKLSGHTADFTTSGLADEMRRHGYYLQYMIYALALHAWLQQALKNYNFQEHFGGIHYLFLRGADPLTGQGLFHDRPSLDLINALAEFFAAGKGIE